VIVPTRTHDPHPGGPGFGGSRRAKISWKFQRSSAPGRAGLVAELDLVDRDPPVEQAGGRQAALGT
jgi:hypothetical protein